jgi:alcohol dehydrogenase class IV
LSALSAFNAIAHAVEALYAPDTNPVISLMAEEGVRAIVGALPALAQNPHDLSVRSDLLYGAWLCSCCLGATTMGLHHKLCHTLGGLFDLPHAETHTVVLPYALNFNAPAIPEVLVRLGRAMEVSDPVAALIELQRNLRLPMSLRDLGMPKDGVARAVEVAIGNPYRNPREFSAALLTELLEHAWAGIDLI